MVTYKFMAQSIANDGCAVSISTLKSENTNEYKRKKKRYGNNIYTNMTCHRYEEDKKEKKCATTEKKISSNERIKLCI